MSEKVQLGQHPDFPFCHVLQESDFCYTEPYPTNEQLAVYYNATYRAVRQETPTADYVKFMKARAKVQADFIRDSAERNTFAGILDIGSGCGTLLAELESSGNALEGWEPDAEMFNFGNEHFSSSKVRFVNDLFIPERTERKFDLITMSHVLEHVPHPGVFLAKLRDYHLSESGYLFIEVPNDPAWWVKIQLERRFEGLGHINYFTPTSLENLLLDVGFARVKLRTRGISVQDFSLKRTLKPSWIQRVCRKVFPQKLSCDTVYKHSPSNLGIYIQCMGSVS